MAKTRNRKLPKKKEKCLISIDLSTYNTLMSQAEYEDVSLETLVASILDGYILRLDDEK